MRGTGQTPRTGYFRCLLTYLVSSNIEAWALPNSAFSLSSALIMRRFTASCSFFFLMYAQILLVTSVRGIGVEPMIAASGPLGISGRMNAAFGLRLTLALTAFFATFFAAAFFAGAFFAAFAFFVAIDSSPRRVQVPQRQRSRMKTAESA